MMDQVTKVFLLLDILHYFFIGEIVLPLRSEFYKLFQDYDIFRLQLRERTQGH